MIDPDKLPAAAVEAANSEWSSDFVGRSKINRAIVAAFLDALLADDRSIDRMIEAYPADDDQLSWQTMREGARSALIAAFQEER